MTQENIGFRKYEAMDKSLENKEKEPQAEQVLLLLKPGAVEYESRLEKFLAKKGLKIIDRREMNFDKEKLLEFYPGAVDAIARRNTPEQVDEVMSEWVNYFLEGPAVALLVEGENALAIASRLKKKLRGILRLGRPRDGLHAADTIEETEQQKRVAGFSE